MRIGTYDQRLTFQRLSTTTDAMGSVIESWTDVFTVWGKVQVDKSDEGMESGQRTGKQAIIISVRSNSKTTTLTSTDRLYWKGKDFNLSPPRPFPAGRPERIEFSAMARSN